MSDSDRTTPSLQQLYEQLKKRRVFRTGVAYLLAAWAIIQVAATVQPYLDWPAWVVSTTIIVAGTGFPVALTLGWFFDLPTKRTRWTIAGRSLGGVTAAVSMVLLAAVGLSAMVWRKRQPELTDDRIVVVPFSNETGDPKLDALGKLAADWITQGIARTGVGEVVPTSQVLEWIRQGVPTSTDGVPEHALAVESRSRIVVSGSYYLYADSLQFIANVWDARRGHLLGATAPVKYPVTEPTHAIEALRQRVMGLVAAYFDEFRRKGVANRVLTPPDYRAWQLWLQAFERWLSGDSRAAAELYAKAASADTVFRTEALIYSLVPLVSVGEYAKADSVITDLEAMRDQLPRQLRALVAVWRAQFTGSRTALREAEGVWLRESGDDPETLHNAGFSGPRYHDPKFTLDLWKDLDFDHGWLARLPWNWEVWSEAYHMLGKHRQELRIARDGRRRFPDRLTHVAYEARALAALGRTRELEELLTAGLSFSTPPAPAEAREVEPWSVAPFRFGPHDYTAGDLLRETGLELRAHGNVVAGRRLIRRSVEWYSTREDALTGTRRPALAATYIAAGNWQAARVVYEGLAREDTTQVNWQGRLGVIAASTGDTATAARLDAWLRDLKLPYLWGRNTYWRAAIAAHRGKHEEAFGLLQQALSETWPSGAYLHSSPEFMPLWKFAAFRNFVRLD